MFELSVACKYLIPRRRQLSVSIISLVSTLVIALVVWLIVVFFSVKDGLENTWVNKIVALTAPIRITPTEKYYNSYYYLIDKISSNSDYTGKNIGEKLNTPQTDPYDPLQDEEVPLQWAKPDLDPSNTLKDLVKEAFAAASQLPDLKNLQVNEFETSMAHLQLKLIRHPSNQATQQFIEQAVYIGTFDNLTPTLSTMLLAPTPTDIQNALYMQEISPNSLGDSGSDSMKKFNARILESRIQSFFDHFHVTALKTPSQGWHLPLNIFPESTELSVLAIIKHDKIVRIIVPSQTQNLPILLQQFKSENAIAKKGILHIDQGKAKFESEPLATWIPIVLEPETILPVTIIPESLTHITHLNNVQFTVDTTIQGIPLQGTISLGKLIISDASLNQNRDSSIMALSLDHNQGINLPKDPLIGEAVLLPRSFKDGGALIGDQGYLSYYSPTPSSVQEQRIPIFVAGFYDPGIMPIGGKYLLGDKPLISAIRGSYSPEESLISNGINIRFDNLENASQAKANLLKAFHERGIAPYWHVETFREYDFTKDLLQQLHSEKNLFSLISLIIIIVACSNIISMLIILVNDKKLEIGILRSMGATSGSIAMIFGVCGMVMGAIGSLLGVGTAIITLKYVNELVGFIGSLQGHDLFNPVFYGNVLPSEVSYEALSFVVLTTAGISLLAGIVPAIKASMLRPSTILRAE